MANTIYWHDYEAFGANPRRDRASQFAGIRTNEALEEVGEPLVMYCRPAPDMLPHPEACLITGITPQKALAEGCSEAEFIAAIQAQLAVPGTCTAGYNSIRFDDELTRQLLYRNFHDPYEREWKHGNSRWDIIDMMRLCHALRPEGINWPVRDDGSASFRLEQLTQANSIVHEGAHDALSDVRATIALAALVRQQQPRLFQFAYGLRRKKAVLEQLDLTTHKPVLHVSSIYRGGAALAPVVPLCRHPRDSNGVIVCDLRVDPTDWLHLSADAMRARLFVREDDLPPGETRIPVTVIHVNRCPVLAPMATLEPARAKALEVDLDACRRHWRLLMDAEHLTDTLSDVFSGGAESVVDPDPDFALYSGGFFSDHDRREMNRLRATAVSALAETHFDFQDPRLPEMLFRYRARNYPETLNANEHQRWQVYCEQRLQRDAAEPGAGLSAGEFHLLLQSLNIERSSERDRQVLAALEEYARQLLPTQ